MSFATRKQEALTQRHGGGIRFARVDNQMRRFYFNRNSEDWQMSASNEEAEERFAEIGGDCEGHSFEDFCSKYHFEAMLSRPTPLAPTAPAPRAAVV